MTRTPGQWATLVLGACCGLLALAALLQAAGIGSGYRLLADQTSELEAELTRPLEQAEFQLPDYAQFIEIAQRPLFTQDRRPRPIDAKESQVASSDAPPTVPLNATLLGVLLDPEHRVAMLRDNSTSTVLRVREGMPLPGDLAGWTLRELEPRRAVFDGGPAQGSAELKLDMAKTPAGMPLGMVPTPPPGSPGAPGAPGQLGTLPQNLPTDEAARQAEVQRIIEQRRAQMRAEAEKMSAQQGKQ